MAVLLSAGVVVPVHAQKDSISIDEVVVTGTRNSVDVRHLPMTVTVIGRDVLTAQEQSNVLPAVS